MEESRGFSTPGPEALHLVPGRNQLVDLVLEAKVVTATDKALHFYPQGMACSPFDPVALFLHVALHMPNYIKAAIIHSCRSHGGEEEVYMDLSYEQLWAWLVGEANKGLPISAWPAGSGLLFVDYMRNLWSVYEKAQHVVLAIAEI